MAKNYMVLYGKNSVIERLKADPSSVRKVFLRDNLKAPGIEELISANNVPNERLPEHELDKMRPAKDLQGVIARVNKFQYASFEDLLEQSKDIKTTFLFLDRINDPQNLGAIIRIAACFGGFAAVIPQFDACEVNETVIHVASGGENHIPVSIVNNISNAILKAKERGFWIMGAVIKDDAEDVSKVSMPFPLGLVLGSEGEGIRHGIEKHLDIKAKIPMEGAKLSFNVSTACAIFCHEISKHRGKCDEERE